MDGPKLTPKPPAPKRDKESPQMQLVRKLTEKRRDTIRSLNLRQNGVNVGLLTVKKDLKNVSAVLPKLSASLAKQGHPEAARKIAVIANNLSKHIPASPAMQKGALNGDAIKTLKVHKSLIKALNAPELKNIQHVTRLKDALNSGRALTQIKAEAKAFPRDAAELRQLKLAISTHQNRLTQQEQRLLEKPDEGTLIVMPDVVLKSNQSDFFFQKNMAFDREYKRKMQQLFQQEIEVKRKQMFEASLRDYQNYLENMKRNDQRLNTLYMPVETTPSPNGYITTNAWLNANTMKFYVEMTERRYQDDKPMPPILAEMDVPKKKAEELRAQLNVRNEYTHSHAPRPK